MPLPSIDCLDAPRVRLRPVADADLPDLLQVNGDPQVTAFLPYATWAGLDDARAWLDRMTALAATGTGQQLVVQRRSDDRVVGTVLLFKFDAGSARAELGYALGRDCWRQGLMREALVALCRHAFGPLALRRLEAEVNPANIASNQLLLALGFTREGTLRQRWVAKGSAYDTHAYGLLAAEWREPPGAAVPGR